MEDINVFLIDFKGSKVREEVCQNEDGSYSIFINARLSYEAQREAYSHAMGHILNNDFQKQDVQQIEAEAHGEAPKAVKVVSFHNRKKMKRPTKAERDKVAREVEFLQDLALVSGMDYNEMMLRKAEKQRLYGGL